MLYVFNSGFRNKYRANLLAGLALPPSAPYLVSYQRDRNVSDAAFAALGQLQPGDPALLIFIDRYLPGPYQFVPVRRAVYVRHRLDAGRVEIELKLTEWPQIAPNQSFTNWATANLVPLGAPHKIPNDGAHDGDYAVVGAELPHAMFTSDDGWLATAKALADTQALQDAGDERVVFARLDLIESGKVGQIMRWSEKAASKAEALYRKLFDKPPRQFRFLGGRSYLARVTYLFPHQRVDRNAVVPYRVEIAGGLVPVGNLAGLVSAEQRSDSFEFRAPPLGSGVATVGLSFGESKVIAPRIEVTGEFGWSPVLAFVAVAVGAVWIVGSGYTAQMASDTHAFRWGFYFASTLQWLAMVFMFRIFGVKP